MSFSIGVARFDAPKQGHAWHKLQPGSNHYRILPPMFSYAQDGRYARFIAFHGGFKNTAGRTCMFECIETKNRETKLVTQHCPVCDLVTQRAGEYEMLKKAKEAGQVSEDHVKKFWNEQVFPFKAQKSFFMNAIDSQNKIGVLGVPYKLFQALNAELKRLSEQFGIDATGENGVWIDLIKDQAYKGSKDVNYSAKAVIVSNGPNQLSLKPHQLTKELINSLATSAVDLALLYRKISPAEIAQLVAAPAEVRPQVVDRVFGKANATPEASPLNASIPGTVATGVGRIEHQPDGGFQVNMPSFTSPQAPAPLQFPPGAQPVQFTQPAPFQPTFAPNPAPVAAPVYQPQPIPQYQPAPQYQPQPVAPVFQPTPTTGFQMGQTSLPASQPGATGGISDAEFLKTFGG